MKCKITRTHDRGRSLRDKDYGPPVDGPIHLITARHQELRRDIRVLRVHRQMLGGATSESPIPDLWEPLITTMQTDYGAMMITGWEEVDGQRYYQGWYVRFE